VSILIRFCYMIVPNLLLETGEVHQEDAAEDQIVDFSVALFQMSRPSPSRPTFLMNIDVSSPMVRNLRIPESLLNKRTVDTDNLPPTSNITPEYTIVEPHLDHGLDGLLYLAFGMKLIMCWPPTIKNLRVLCLSQPLHRQCDELEGGMIYLLHENCPAMVIFAGTIHATVTLEGSTLTGINWFSAEAHHPFTLGLVGYELNARGTGDVSIALNNYSRQLKLTLKHSQGIDKTQVLMN
jgi:hypothetical protein